MMAAVESPPSFQNVLLNLTVNRVYQVLQMCIQIEGWRRLRDRYRLRSRNPQQPLRISNE